MLQRNLIVCPGLVTAVAIILLGPSQVLADTILLKGNRSVSGRITSETEQSVSIEADEGRFTFPRSQVLRITKDSPAQNQMMDVSTLLQRGELERALSLYRVQDLESKLAPDALESLLLNSLSEIAGTVISTSQTATWLSRQFLQKPQPPMELLLLAAALSADTGQDDAALALIQKVPIPPTRQPQWPYATLSLLLNRIADAAVAHSRGDLVGATATVAAQLIPGKSPTEKAVLVDYGRIDQYRRNDDLLRATALFRPDHFLHRADLFRPLAERVLASIMANGSRSSSIAALESARTTILPYVDARLREQALKTLLSNLIRAGRVDDAQSIADDVSNNDPDMGAIALHLVEFTQRKASLSKDKPLEKYKLAAWARSMGLLDEARGLFSELKQDPRFSENAAMQIELIENSRCQVELAHLRELFDLGRLDRVKSDAKKFLDSAPAETYAAKARALVQLADFQKWSETNSARGKIEAEYQQAERLANRGEFDAALLQLNRLQLNNADPVAAVRARKLRDRIIQEKARMRIQAARDATEKK